MEKKIRIGKLFNFYNIFHVKNGKVISIFEERGREGGTLVSPNLNIELARILAQFDFSDEAERFYLKLVKSAYKEKFLPFKEIHRNYVAYELGRLEEQKRETREKLLKISREINKLRGRL